MVGVPAGRRSGKTELSKRKLVESLPVLKPWGDPRYFYAAPTRDQAKLIAWEDLKLMVPPNWVLGEPHESELRIDTKFGSSLHVVGLDKPQRIEGVPWDGGVVDESCDIKPKTVDLTIGPTLVDRNGWLWRIGVPKRFGVGADEFRTFCEAAEREMAKAAKEDRIPDIASYTWPSADIQPKEKLRWFQENMDAVDYAEQFDASWQTVSGRIFHAYAEDYNVRSCSFDPKAAMIVGCDFNVDPMCWIMGHPRGRPPEGYIEWFDELHIRNTNTPKTLDALWEKYGRHAQGTISFYGDATGKADKTSASMSDYEHIVNDKRFKGKGATVHFPAANPGRANRFAACNAVLRSASGNVRCFFDPRCEYTLTDIRVRAFKPGTKEPADKGDVGHPTDAWGYPTYMLYPIVDTKGEAKVIIKRPGEKHGNGKGGNGRGNGRQARRYPRSMNKTRRRH
jgi:hypothetical protein